MRYLLLVGFLGMASASCPDGEVKLNDQCCPVTDGVLLNCNGYCPSGNVVIPNEAGVTSIGDYAFEDCTECPTSMDLSQTELDSIGEWAFSYCSGLTSVTFPEGLTSIGNKAFFNCSGLASVTFPEGYTEHSSIDEDDY